MRICALIFSLILAVPASEAALSCFQRYTYCSLPLINNWGKTYNCSLAVPFIKCVTNVTRECHPEYVTYFEDYQDLILDVCDPDSSKKEEWKKAEECFAKNVSSFRSCTENLQDNDCKALSDMTTCFTTKTQDTCGEFAANVTKKLLSPFTVLAAECQKTMAVKECLLNNTEGFLSCKLKGEVNNVGDICSSVGGQIQCFVQKTAEFCGKEAKESIQPYTEDISFVMDVCKIADFISGIKLSECDKGVLKCHIELLNVDQLTCTSVSNYVGCMAAAVKICEGDDKPLYLLALENYKKKFPYYCNKESAFRKNFQKMSECINSTFDGVWAPCYDKLQNDKQETKEDDKVGTLRAYVNFLDCLSKDFGEKCNKEAQSAINDLLNPMEDSMDESCRLLTGKRCNSATGLIAGTWLLIGSLLFLLTRKDE